MSCGDSVGNITDEIFDVSSVDFIYLDSEDNWLSTDPNQTFTVNNSCNSYEDITVWIKNAFCSEKSRGTHMTLVNKLDELKLMSPSIDSRTFTRQKRNLHKRQSLFNGNGLSTLCSPVNEDDFSSPEANERTFEVKKSLNGTFTKAPTDTTFTLPNDQQNQLNNIEDVEKMAKQQEDSLRQSCSNGWAASNQRSPPRSQLITSKMNSAINSNTLTKSRDPNRYARLESELNHYHMNGNEDDYYENELSPEDTFRVNVSYNTSTPLVPKYRKMNTTQELREPTVPSIMPDVSNLRPNNGYSKSKIGKSEPNLSQRLQPLTRGLGYNSKPGSYSMANRAMGNPLSNNFLQQKVASDSRLLVKNGLKPQNQIQNVGRVTSPPPSQSQQLLNRKVAVEGELNRVVTTTANTTNLCRKSTFRVRDYAINSEENLKENGFELCLTNTSASTNGFKTNKTNNNNNVQRNISKIPAPKLIRSGIPVCGQRTAIPCPTNNNNKAANHTDNSWKNGCF